MNLPSSVKIFDVVYEIEYVEKPSDVDIYKRQSLWGQIDYWTRTIRIYKNDRQDSDVMQTLWHEVIHGIAMALHIDEDVSDEGNIVDLLATGINNVVVDNNWVNYRDANFKMSVQKTVSASATITDGNLNVTDLG